MRCHRLAKAAAGMSSYKIWKIFELVSRARMQDAVHLRFRPAWIVGDGSPAVNLVAWGALHRPEDYGERLAALAFRVLSSRESLSFRLRLRAFKKMPGVTLARLLPGTRLPLPEAVVFLKAPPEELLRRIASRGEKKQIHETPEKLASLQDAYATVCRVLQKEFGTRIIEIETTGKTPEAIAGEALCGLHEERKDM